ncbi:MAG TPA: alkaline phosphatase family protein [Candidatus Hydrogenedentes bacterium]|nr:alkaline phosphatase family protein [Candidatus Hydrogenedentota bacterium]
MPLPRVERVLVIGLDCAAPRFVFGPDAFDLPRLRALMSRGRYGALRSCDPPITVPAWACMMSGKDPGALGLYGFRNRKDRSYDALFTANASSVHAPRVWDILSRAGKKVVVLGVPQTYPVRPVNGWLVADFLAPDTQAQFTYPQSLADELRANVGEYLLDVEDFRTHDKDALLERLYALMENRFAAARHLMDTKPWDFFMMVEMGVDRLHHGFCKYCDPAHPLFEAGNRYESVFHDYYRAVDQRIGELLDRVGDETAVLIVSDHGAKAMQGGVCINQWLIREGLLTLREESAGRRRIEDCAIDWARTKVWSSGGYYARMFFNVQGREPEGVVSPREYESFRDEMIAKIESMPGPDGRPLGNRALKPQDIYRRVEGIAPDLIVYLGDLAWRSVGMVGFDSVYTFENDTGPDDANHDYDGIFILDDRSRRSGEALSGLRLLDVAPTVLALFGLEAPSDMQGKAISS